MANGAKSVNGRRHLGIHAEMIRSVLERRGRPDLDSRHVEGYMRVGHGTLDGLSWPEFEAEVLIAIDCVDEGGAAAAEENARSFGL